MVPLPQTVREKVVFNKHPGLALDKYANSCLTDNQDKLQEMVQKPTIKKVVELSQVQPQGLAFENLCQRRETILSALGADRFFCTSTGPLALHLARASALENAGICLHHIYGFAYLPGSGLKGMARAYAREVWLPSVESDKSHAEKKILSVFGNEPQKKPFECGDIVFHDAWPQKWPQLILDIVNNHHSAYYSGEENAAPGDWEDPVPVYFMAVVPGIPFSFAISPRRKDTDAELVQLAREWLIGALCYMGAGAKTNAGYGSFAPVNDPKPILPEKTRAVFETEVELVTPAFLAGALQNQSDCQLRSATLRGLLRWWWRTMHARHVNARELREMESLIWGDTQAGGAVRLDVRKKDPSLIPERYAYKDKFKPKPNFKEKHNLQPPPGKQFIQGLFYLSYGMDDGKNQRWYQPPGTKWQVLIVCRDVVSKKDGNIIVKAPLVLEQVKCALWLFCNYGGVGSKGRNGFGSLQATISDVDFDFCKKSSNELRKILKYDSASIAEPMSAALENMVSKVIQTPWNDPWFILDQLGYAAQSFAKQFKHNAEKKALGLPRKIHGPRDDRPMPHQDARKWKPARALTCVKGSRHASPTHFHLFREVDGSLTVHIVAFPSAVLPDFNTSKRFLKAYIDHLEKDIKSFHEKFLNLSNSNARRPMVATGKTLQKDSFSKTESPRPVIQAPTPESMLWPVAVLNYAPNTREVTATFEQLSATTKDIEMIPDSLKEKLMAKKKRKPVKAKVEVIRLGNNLTIRAIHLPD
jgi:CRISPR-associated protein Cmr6